MSIIVYDIIELNEKNAMRGKTREIKVSETKPYLHPARTLVRQIVESQSDRNFNKDIITQAELDN